MSDYKQIKQQILSAYDNHNRAELENLLAELDDVLLKTQRRYLDLFKNAKDPLLVLDTDAKIVECNQASIDLLKLKNRDNLRGLTPADFSPEKQPDGTRSETKAKAYVQQAFSQGFVRFEWLHVDFQGKLFFADVMLNSAEFNGQKLIFAVWRDISEQKNTQLALERYKQMMNGVFNGAPIGIMLLDENYKLIDANPSFYNLLGYSQVFYAENNFHKYTVHEDILKQQQLIDDTKNGKIDSFKITKRYIRADDKLIWVNLRVNVIRDNDKQVKFYIAVGEDITRQKEAKIELQKFRTAIEQSQFSIVITDVFGDIEYVNPYFYHITGYTQQEVIGRNPRILKTEQTAPDFYNQMWQQISSGIPWKGEFLNRKKDGTLYHELSVIAPVKDQKGNIINYIALKEDITERKIIEQQLQDTVNSRNKFFSIIAHDLRTPFSIQLGFADLLSRNFDKLTDEKKLRYVHMIRQSTQQTYDLLEKLLAWARTQNGKIQFEPQKTDISLILQSIIDDMKIKTESKKITVINKTNCPACPVFADPNLLDTIFRNLFSNAVKFTPKNGKIICNTNINQTNIEISIADTGVGIKPENLEKLFRIETTFTTLGTDKEEGNGLGLSLVKEFVHLHKGTINVDSVYGKGTIFKVTLPHTKLT